MHSPTRLFIHLLTPSLRYTLTIVVNQYLSNFAYWNGVKSCSVESIEGNSSYQLGEYFAEKILMVHDPVFRVGYEGDIGVTLLPLLGTHSLACLIACLLTYSLTQAYSSSSTVCCTSVVVVIVFIALRS
jgi:hypothetical protein